MTSPGAANEPTVVFVAHGSRAAEANQAHAAAAQRLARATRRQVIPAFLELTEPSIPDAIARAVDAGATHIVVLPFFLYPGRHLVEDIPALVAAASAAHPGVTVSLLDAFGADPVVVDVLAEQIRRATGEPIP